MAQPKCASELLGCPPAGACSEDRLWCAEMMKCLSDAVPDYVERVKSLVLSKSKCLGLSVWIQSLFWASAVLGGWSVGRTFLQIQVR